MLVCVSPEGTDQCQMGGIRTSVREPERRHTDGRYQKNTAAPIMVGTTEILRNQLYDVMHSGED